MPKAAKGVLIQADPSIKTIIMKIDQDSGHAYVIEELDEHTLVVKEVMLAQLKGMLDEELSNTQIMFESDDD